jgi:uncharacterized protein YcbK (DUF882 family)
MSEIITRRNFLKLGAAGAGLGLAPSSLSAAFGMKGMFEKKITLHNIHTGENLKAVFWADGHYIHEGLDEISYLLRDFRQNSMVDIDRELIETLYNVQLLVGNYKSIDVLSGYRSSKTQKMLRRTGHRVARDSMHTHGKAVDIKMKNTSIRAVRNAATVLKRGGVGYYPRNGFVHIDTGKVRSWRG